LEFERSKVKQYTTLSQFGVLTPKTVVVTGSKLDSEFATRITKQAEKTFNGVPFVTKHNRGGSGNGVRLFRTAHALQSYVGSNDYTESPDCVTLLQTFIDNPNRFITRCEFVGGQFMYAVNVDASKGFSLCPADNCAVDDEFCPISKQEEKPPVNKFTIDKDYSSPLLEKYAAFLRANGIEIAGIESTTDALGDVYTYDVNTNTNYNGDAETKAYGGLYGMTRVAAFLDGELKKYYD